MRHFVLSVCCCSSLALSPSVVRAEAGSAAAASSETGAAAAVDAASPRIHQPFELGVYAGALFPPSDHSLRDPNRPAGEYESVAPQFGLRVGILPWRFVGIEAEGSVMPSATTDGQGAMLYAARAHLLFQVPTRHVTPFVLVGTGRLFADSETLGKDSDRGVHFGGGLKIALQEHLFVRVDIRDTVLPKQLANDTPHWVEGLIGVSYAFGGPPPPPPPPPPPGDSDGDGLTDDVDQCPTIAANTADGCPVPDFDGDGVLDPYDECPREAGTLPNGCPDLDPDKDGVPLPDDQCPDEPGVPPDGCPDRDADGDGIPVPQDQCPDEPETVNGFEDEDGCPDEVPEEVKQFTGVIRGIHFDFGKATVRADSHALLDQAAKVLQEYPALKLEVSGHSDSVGSRERNMELSQARAEAVKQYLVSKGIAPERLTTRGVGPDEPVADNATPDGRAANRRIEFKIIQ